MDIKYVPGIAASGTIVITHKDRYIEWSSSTFDTTELKKEDSNVFMYLNQYWSSKSSEELDDMFELYLQLKIIVDTPADTNDLSIMLRDPIAQLLDKHHGLDSIRHWLNFYADISVPNTITEEFIVDDTHTFSKESTYLREDYLQLVSLSMALRALIPVWSEYIISIKDEVGINFKEYYAYRLINNSKVMRSGEINKLQLYIEKLIDSDEASAESALNGISRHDLPTHLTGQTLVRRVCIADIRGISPASNIVAFIYKFVMQKLAGRKPGGNSFNNVVRAKMAESSTIDGDKNSFLEGYKIQENISIGTIATLNHFANYDVKRLALMIDPTIESNLELVETALQNVLELETKVINEAQIAIMRWVIAKIISPRSIEYLNKRSLLRCLAIAQAILWHRNHKVLAALVSSYQNKQTDTMRIVAVENRGRIPTELINKLNELYPHQLRAKSRLGDKGNNAAIIAIDNVTDLLAECEWVLTIPAKWYSEVAPNQISCIYTAPFSIRSHLAKLVIDVAAGFSPLEPTI